MRDDETGEWDDDARTNPSFWDRFKHWMNKPVSVLLFSGILFTVGAYAEYRDEIHDDYQLQLIIQQNCETSNKILEQGLVHFATTIETYYSTGVGDLTAPPAFADIPQSVQTYIEQLNAGNNTTGTEPTPSLTDIATTVADELHRDCSQLTVP